MCNTFTDILFIYTFSEAVGSYAENRKIISIRKVYQVMALTWGNVTRNGVHVCIAIGRGDLGGGG